jgi:hypothetical protein
LVVLACFWRPSVSPFLGWFDPWLRFPEIVYVVVGRGEFVMSATTALGILLRRCAIRKCSLGDYIFALGGALISVLAVFLGYGWIRL